MKWKEILNRRLGKRNLEYDITKPTQVNRHNMKRVVDDIYTALNKVKVTSSANVMREDFSAIGGDEGQLRVIKGTRVPSRDSNGQIDDDNTDTNSVKLAVRDSRNSVYEVELLAKKEGE
jgi:hypothetical protein